MAKQMTIGVAKELQRDESCLAMAPQSAKDLQKLGYECLIEKGTGVASGGSGFGGQGSATKARRIEETSRCVDDDQFFNPAASIV